MEKCVQFFDGTSYGFSYNGLKYYYPKVSSITFSLNPTTVPYATPSILTTKINGANITGRNIVSKSAIISVNKTNLSFAYNGNVYSGKKTLSANTIGFTTNIYNKNTTNSISSNTMNLTTYLTYYVPSTPFGATKTLTFKQSLNATVAANPTIKKDSSYYTYYSTYYTYYNANNKTLSKVYYSITGFTLRPNVNVCAQNGCVVLTPVVSSIAPAAYAENFTKVNKVNYYIKSPYALSLSNAKQLNSGTTSSLQSIAVYNTNTKTSNQLNNVSATAYFANGIIRTATVTLTSAGKPIVKPEITSFTLTANPSFMAYNGTSQIKYVAYIKNDSVSDVRYSSISDTSAVMVKNTTPSITSTTTAQGVKFTGNIAQLAGRTNVYHEKTKTKVGALIKTASGLSKVAYVDVTVGQSDLRYYNEYIAPYFTSLVLSSPKIIINAKDTMEIKATPNYGRDTIASVHWSSSNDDVLSIKATSNNLIVNVNANNKEYITKQVTISCTVATKSGLTRTASKIITVKAAEQPTNVKPSVQDVMSKVNAIFDEAKQKANTEISKLA